MIYKNKIKKIIGLSKSNLVVGLDSDIEKIPIAFRKYKNPILEFNLRIIESVNEFCAGYKLNLAFYEAAGLKGIEALEKTVKSIPANRIKICDAKRGDIGNTAELYARAYFDNMDFDSITISPYMGYDSVSPFLKRKDKFVYILLRTSNPGAEDFQTLKSGSKKLFEIVAFKSMKWSENQIGFVIGANHLKEIRKYSSYKTGIPLLIPGIGAQGNDLQDMLKNVRSKNFIINASRSIIFAGNFDECISSYFRKVKAQAEQLNNLINTFRK